LFSRNDASNNVSAQQLDFSLIPTLLRLNTVIGAKNRRAGAGPGVAVPVRAALG
jgi:hypothetical protein